MQPSDSIIFNSSFLSIKTDSDSDSISMATPAVLTHTGSMSLATTSLWLAHTGIKQASASRATSLFPKLISTDKHYDVCVVGQNNSSIYNNSSINYFSTTDYNIIHIVLYKFVIYIQLNRSWDCGS